MLVVLALIENGMKYEYAVKFMRQKWSGDFESQQLLYMEKYCPKILLHFIDTSSHRDTVEVNKTGLPDVLSSLEIEL